MTGQRRVRGPAKIDSSQQAKLDVVRARRIERDNAREELEIRVQQLRESFLVEQDAALRSAVWAAKDADVPAAHIKRVLNITDHRTYQRWLEGYVPPVVVKPEDFGPFSATFRVLHDNDTVAEREGGPADWYFKAHISQYRDWNLSLWLGMGMFNRFGWWVDDKREAWQDIPDDFRSQVLDEDGVLHAEFVDWLKTEVFPAFTKATQQ